MAPEISVRPLTRRGVLLVNVGTPDDPSVKSVRRYLRDFLSDPHVVDLPAPLRWALINLIILPFRPKKSAHAYQQVWTEKGSPLLVHSQSQAVALAAAMPEAEVVLAMRYGNPSLASAVAHFAERGITDITVVPLFPQHAEATSGTIVEAWGKLAPGSKALPAFHANQGFISAMAVKVRAALEGGAEHVLFSYHGLPVRQVAKACGQQCKGQSSPAVCPAVDETNSKCYRAQCYATSHAIAQAAGAVGLTSTSFQSRLQGASWISPFTDETLALMAYRGLRRVAVACPSFVADCLETIEEIGIRGAETFKASGGETLELITAVNDSPVFIAGLAKQLRAFWSP